MSYKIGDRRQMTFLPPTINEYIGPEDPVRVYDAFVEAIDLQELGIPVQPYKAGAHEYHPKSIISFIISSAMPVKTQETNPSRRAATLGLLFNLSNR